MQNNDILVPFFFVRARKTTRARTRNKNLMIEAYS